MPFEGHLGAQRALATALDLRVGRLEEHREGGVGDELRSLLLNVEQPVEPAVDLLRLVADEGDIRVGSGQKPGDPQQDRDAALHVDRAATPQGVDSAAGLPGAWAGWPGRRSTGRCRDGRRGTARSGRPRLGPGHDGVAEAGDVQVAQLAQGSLPRRRRAPSPAG